MKIEYYGYDIYGERLLMGHCEVHPWVADIHPCGECIKATAAENEYDRMVEAQIAEYEESLIAEYERSLPEAIESSANTQAQAGGRIGGSHE